MEASAESTFTVRATGLLAESGRALQPATTNNWKGGKRVCKGRRGEWVPWLYYTLLPKQKITWKDTQDEIWLVNRALNAGADNRIRKDTKPDPKSVITVAFLLFEADIGIFLPYLGGWSLYPGVLALVRYVQRVHLLKGAPGGMFKVKISAQYPRFLSTLSMFKLLYKLNFFYCFDFLLT